MTSFRPAMKSLVAMTMVAVLGGCSSSPRPATTEHRAGVVVPQDLFARVNGVTLHYLDWGGTGDLLLFLPGLAHTAHAFDGIAPAFTDRYRVMGLTRRSHGASEKTAAGYDLETLVDDIVAFMHAVGAKRTILVGHSFAGLELPRVAARVPDQVRGLVFLDAVYDWPLLFDTTSPSGSAQRFFLPPDSALASWNALEDWHRRRHPDMWGPAWAATLRSQTYLREDGRIGWQLPDTLEARFLETAAKGVVYSGIQVPTLAVWANQTDPSAASMKAYGYSDADIGLVRKWMSEVDVKIKRRGIQALKEAVPTATIAELQSPHLMQWFSPKDVIRLMNGFLNGLQH